MPLTANATDTTLQVSTADAERLYNYAENYPSDEVRALVAKPEDAVDADARSETFILRKANIDTSTGIITVDSILYEADYLIASGSFISPNLLADARMDYSNENAWTVVNGAVLAKTTAEKRVNLQSLGITVDAAAEAARQQITVDPLESYIFHGSMLSDGTNSAMFHIEDDVANLVTGSAIISGAWFQDDCVFAVSGSTLDIDAEAVTDGSYTFYTDNLSLLPNILSGNNLMDTAFWSEKGLAIETDSTNQRHGLKCLKLTASTDNTYAFQQVDGLKEGSYFTLKGYAKPSVAGQSWDIRAYAVNGQKYGTVKYAQAKWGGITEII